MIQIAGTAKVQPVTEISRPMPRPTAQVAPYVEALGPELAVLFILEFGGAEIYLAAEPQGRSSVEKFVGQDRAKALATHPGMQMIQRVPLARQWLILMLSWQGYPHAQIARKVRCSDTTVRRYVNADGQGHAP